MTTTTPSYSGYAGNDPSSGTGRHVRRLTETKAGVKTTEFIFMVLFIAGVLIATYIDGDDSLHAEEGWLYAGIVASAYMVSRGLAKLGVHEPYTDDAPRH
jgi:hypothetical protein